MSAECQDPREETAEPLWRGERQPSNREGLHPGALKPAQGLRSTWPEHRETPTLHLGRNWIFYCSETSSKHGSGKAQFLPSLICPNKRLFSTPSHFSPPNQGKKHTQVPGLKPATPVPTQEVSGKWHHRWLRGGRRCRAAGPTSATCWRRGDKTVLPHQLVGMSSSSFFRVFWKKRGGLQTRSIRSPRGRESR